MNMLKMYALVFMLWKHTASEHQTKGWILMHHITWHVLTSFNEGMNNIDNALDDDNTAALALSSSSLDWRDLANAFGAS